MVGRSTFLALVNLIGVLGATAHAKYTFKPEHASTYVNSHVPSLIDLPESQYDIASGTSYWMSSFITSTKGKQYLAVCHAMTPRKNVCRSSVLDLQNLEYWVDFTYCSTDEDKASDTSGPLNADFGTYGFVSTTSDNIAKMYAYSDANASFSFNISWEATSKALLNGGSGSIAFGPGPSNATEWGIPAAKTAGSLKLDGKKIEIDTKNSFTWYDRQLSYGIPRNWTWFQLNFPGTEIKASVWAYDLADGTSYQFATVRKGESQYVLAYDLIPDMSNTWVSPNSGLVYPLCWRLEFENGDHLVIKSIRPDQEMYGSESTFDSAYEGFITVSGKFLEQSHGFGVVELATMY